jgi:DNA (cytosine-5)-methyltransferase 1
MSGPDIVEVSAQHAVMNVLQAAYREAERIVADDTGPVDLDAQLGAEARRVLARLGVMRHAARGVALTLIAYKAAFPGQDIRAHKSEHAGGFSGRTIDTRVTVPFLIERTLPRSVETHWLSQTFSFAGPYVRGSDLRTSPKDAGPLLIEAVNLVHEAGSRDFAFAATVALIEQLVRIRNSSGVTLTRPKALSMERTVGLVERHLRRRYRANAPRLPQLVMYAVYRQLVASVSRYAGMRLEPLQRMKSADRKSGTVGDVVVTENGFPVEAVEVKYGQEVAFIHVAEAIDKVRAASVRRYYILSTEGIATADAEAIDRRRAEFLEQNGCEIIINGVLDSLSYYLRLLPSTTDFIFAYVDLLRDDEDATYEHRIAWNECCQGSSP